MSTLGDAISFALDSTPDVPPVSDVSGDGEFHWDCRRWVPIETLQSQPRQSRADRIAAVRAPKWLVWLVISLFPLAVGIAWWESSHLWLAWLAIPLVLLAVGVAWWDASHTSKRQQER
jgi:hypothetical protein